MPADSLRADDPRSHLRVLLVCTRDPGGRLSGRKTVLLTIMRSLRRLGHEVELAVLARGDLQPLPEDLGSLPTVQLPVPGVLAAALRAVVRFPRRELSLNECLFTSRRGRSHLRALVSERGYDLIIADMIRAAPLVCAQDRPFVIDLDDRLSDRYRMIAESPSDTSALLGYYSEWLPRPLRRLATRAARRLLAREAQMLRERELAVARLAAGVSLVAQDEADNMAADLGRPVFGLSMAVAVRPEAIAVSRTPPGSMIFVGGLDYHANVEALRWFVGDILPRLRDQISDFELTVVGYCPEPVRAELERPGVRIRGYVEDLQDELTGHRAFLAPIVSGHGIKTKVLEAMAAGLPVISTSQGLAGLDADTEVNCLAVDSARHFAEACVRLARDAELATQIGRAGRDYVVANFSDRALAQKWSAMLASAMTASRSNANFLLPEVLA